MTNNKLSYRGCAYIRVAKTQDDVIVDYIAGLATRMVKINETNKATYTKIGQLQELFNEMRNYFRLISSG